MEKEKIQEVRQSTEEFVRKDRLKVAAAAVLILSVSVFAASQYVDFSLSEEPGNETSTDKVELTDYQQDYVDCPPEHLELCTKMSKIPTEPVEFISANSSGNNRLRLKMGENGVIVAKIEDGGDGHMIRCKPSPC